MTVKELFSQVKSTTTGNLSLNIPPADVAIYRIITLNK
jgi:hypothetical protein